MPADFHSSFIHLTNSLSENKVFLEILFPYFSVFFKFLFIFTNSLLSNHFFYHAHLSLLPAAICGSLLNSLRYSLRLSWST